MIATLQILLIEASRVKNCSETKFKWEKCTAQDDKLHLIQNLIIETDLTIIKHRMA